MELRSGRSMGKKDITCHMSFPCVKHGGPPIPPGWVKRSEGSADSNNNDGRSLVMESWDELDLDKILAATGLERVSKSKPSSESVEVSDKGSGDAEPEQPVQLKRVPVDPSPVSGPNGSSGTDTEVPAGDKIVDINNTSDGVHAQQLHPQKSILKKPTPSFVTRPSPPSEVSLSTNQRKGQEKPTERPMPLNDILRIRKAMHGGADVTFDSTDRAYTIPKTSENRSGSPIISSIRGPAVQGAGQKGVLERRTVLPSASYSAKQNTIRNSSKARERKQGWKPSITNRSPGGNHSSHGTSDNIGRSQARSNLATSNLKQVCDISPDLDSAQTATKNASKQRWEDGDEQRAIPVPAAAPCSLSSPDEPYKNTARESDAHGTKRESTNNATPKSRWELDSDDDQVESLVQAAKTSPGIVQAANTPTQKWGWADVELQVTPVLVTAATAINNPETPISAGATGAATGSQKRGWDDDDDGFPPAILLRHQKPTDNTEAENRAATKRGWEFDSDDDEKPTRTAGIPTPVLSDSGSTETAAASTGKGWDADDDSIPTAATTTSLSDRDPAAPISYATAVPTTGQQKRGWDDDDGEDGPVPAAIAHSQNSATSGEAERSGAQKRSWGGDDDVDQPGPSKRSRQSSVAPDSDTSRKVGRRECFKCGQEGHIARNCTASNEAGKSRSSTGACFECGKTGHMARECKEEAAGSASGGRRPRPCCQCPEGNHDVSQHYHLFFYRLPEGVTSDSLAAKCGDGIRRSKAFTTNAGKAMGHVIFETKEAADACIQAMKKDRDFGVKFCSTCAAILESA